jgi:hypothetical protein
MYENFVALYEININYMENIALRFVHNKGNRVKNSPTSLLIEVRQIGTNRAVYINSSLKI